MADVHQLAAAREESGADAALNPIKLYWKSIEEYQPLDRQEEAELARRAHAGDEEAFQRLVTANLRFVVSIALEYTGRGLSMPELVSEGNMGLIKAVHRFDPERGCKLITYAVWWIREAIHSALRRARGPAALTASKLMDLKRIRRESSDMSHELGKELGLEEAGERLGFDAERTRELLHAATPDFSLDAPVFGREGATWEAQLAVEDGNVEAQLEQQALNAMVRDSLALLDEREQYIVRRYFGLDGKDEDTLEEIGHSMGITRERTRQLRNRALKKIRQNHGNILMDFMQN